MRRKVLPLLSLLLLFPMRSSFASTVEVSFSGVIDASDIAGILIGTSFSGEFIYDTNSSILFTGANFRHFALDTGAFSLNVGADSLTNTNGNASFPDLVQVTTFVTFGNLEIAGQAMAGSGPLDGGSAFVFFDHSLDSAITALTLPFPFPTDFQTFSLLVLAPGFDAPSASGDITFFSVVNTPTDVPEPGAVTLFSSGLAVLALVRRRRIPEVRK